MSDSSQYSSNHSPDPRASELYPYAVVGVGTGGFVAVDLRTGLEGTVYTRYSTAETEVRLLKFIEALSANAAPEYTQEYPAFHCPEHCPDHYPTD